VTPSQAHIFAQDERGLFLNLCTASTVCHVLDDGTPITLRIESNFPHAGTATPHIENDVLAEVSLRLGLPAWCEEASVPHSSDPTATLPGAVHV
jgi:DUF1680 family protein